MRPLDRVIFNVFNAYTYNRYGRLDVGLTTGIKYMELPINEDTFELPVFASEPLWKLIRYGEDIYYDAIVVKVSSKGLRPSYKSLDGMMREGLNLDFSNRLMYLDCVKQGNEVLPYYVSHGSVFDRNMNPCMLCSFIVERHRNPDSLPLYVLKKFLIRISPEVLKKEDALQRYIVNKILPVFLDSNPRFFSRNVSDSSFPVRVQKDPGMVQSVVVEPMPFIPRKADAPSISTTNEVLKQCVIDHIEELRL